MKHRIIYTVNILLIIGLFCGCKKLVEVDGPPTSVNSKNIYNNDATAIGSITSLYVNLSNAYITGPGEISSLSCMAGLSADELTYFNNAGNTSLDAYYKNALTSLNAGGGGDYWCVNYHRLYVINAAIEGLTAPNKLTPIVKQHLIGEAAFMRGFYYFYLLNLYGEVPLVLNTDYTVNAVIRKMQKMLVYKQIIKDLQQAQSTLSDEYLKGDLINSYSIGAEERIRPNKWAATALLARTYLFMGEWASAETQASNILANNSYFQLELLDKVFLKNNKEAIWQLQPTQIGTNTQEANAFILTSTGPSSENPVYLSDELVKDFETGDQRKNNWTNSVNANGSLYYYPYKFKVIKSGFANAPVTEYSTVLRLAEQYLIRAEARARQNNLIGAIQDLDQIRKRASLPLIKDVNPNINRENLLILIMKEKRIEFFTEWGHRWLDLKRTGNIDEVMNKITLKKSNGDAWKSYQQYYPIWSFELQSNPNLIQTAGY